MPDKAKYTTSMKDKVSNLVTKSKPKVKEVVSVTETVIKPKTDDSKKPRKAVVKGYGEVNYDLIENLMNNFPKIGIKSAEELYGKPIGGIARTPIYTGEVADNIIKLLRLKK